jgi:N6-L-threonylcarbamoyladenine synthase
MNAQGERPLHVLGLESSCDDTAAAVVRVGDGVEVLSSVVRGQDAAHAPYGGVVPEIAARAHAAHLDAVTAAALAEAGLGLDGIDLIAATAGPGLIGGVMSGLTFAKGLALARDCPLVPVNHLAGHALSVQLETEVAYPYLLLLVSGGHTQLIAVNGPTRFRRLGTTIDDAAGEAFDKTAKLLGLEGAGGPAVERLARDGHTGRYDLPRPLLGRPGCDFSFSGLKTAVRQAAERLDPDPQARADLAASFQAAAVEHLLRRTEAAMDACPGMTHLVAAGGVAANTSLRDGLAALAGRYGWTLRLPSLRYCTDNAAMIAYAGAVLYKSGEAPSDGLATAPRARWPLDAREAEVTLGRGRKGRKV